MASFCLVFMVSIFDFLFRSFLDCLEKMTSARLLATLLCVVVLSIILNSNTTEGRYLPTRSNSDRLDKLRELLKEVRRETRFRCFKHERQKRSRTVSLRKRFGSEDRFNYFHCERLYGAGRKSYRT